MNRRHPRSIAAWLGILGCTLLCACGNWMEGNPQNDPARRDLGRYLDDVVYQQRHPAR